MSNAPATATKIDLSVYHCRLKDFLRSKGREADASHRYQCIHPDNHNHGDADFTAVLYEHPGGKDLLYCPKCLTNDDIFEVAGVLEGTVRFPQKLEAVTRSLGTIPPFNGNGNGRAKRDKPPAVIPIPDAAYVALPGEVQGKYCKDRFGEFVASWKWHTARGQVFQVTCRFDRAGGKLVVPFQWGGQKWWTGQVYEKDRPLYRLHELVKSDEPVLLVEGEKCAEIQVTGLILTTWLQGAKAVDLTDFSPLKDREVWIWPDNDKDGAEAAQEIKKRLPQARILSVPEGKPGGWDIADAAEEGIDLVRFIADHLDYTPEKPSEEKKSIRFFSVKDIKAFPPVQYIVESYLPREAVVNLSAYTGAGKSVLACSAAASAMSGIPFLGKFRVFKTGPVLYFDEETPQSFLQDRITKMGFRDDDPFHLAHFTGLKLDREKDFQFIYDAVVEYAPVLVVFDTLIRFHEADENQASEMAVVMGRLRKLSNQGPCILTQIHANKAAGDLRTRSRGSSDIIGGCDLELSISEDDPKKNPGLLTLQSVKARMAPVAPVTFRIQEVDGVLSAVLADESSTEVSDALDEILQESQEAASVTGILSALKDQGVMTSRNTVYRCIEAKLQKDPGSLQVTDKGRAKYYSLTRGQA